jgi:hypothetical protein
MEQAGIFIRRGQLVAVLLANAILWVGALFMVGTPMLGGPAAIALISIASLFLTRRQSS